MGEGWGERVPSVSSVSMSSSDLGKTSSISLTTSATVAGPEAAAEADAEAEAEPADLTLDLGMVADREGNSLSESEENG